MKRGERLMWRKLAQVVQDVVDSDDYAKEFIARRNVAYLVNALKDRNIANVPVFESTRRSGGLWR